MIDWIIGGHLGKGYIKGFKSSIIHFREENRIELLLRFGCTLVLVKESKDEIKLREIFGEVDIQGILSSSHNHEKGQLSFIIKIDKQIINELKVFKSSKEMASESNSIRQLFDKNLILSEYFINTALSNNFHYYGKHEWLGGIYKFNSMETSNGYLKITFNVEALRASFLWYRPDLYELDESEIENYFELLQKGIREEKEKLEKRLKNDSYLKEDL